MCSGFYKFEIHLKVKGHHHSNVEGQSHGNVLSQGQVQGQLPVVAKEPGGHLVTSELKGEGHNTNSEVKSESQVLKCSSVIEVNIVD